jgi:hypothetical protein
VTLFVSLVSICFGGVAGGFVAMWSAHKVERKRQGFQREQDARQERAQAMQTARVLDSDLMAAEVALSTAVNRGQLWVDQIRIPEGTLWFELRRDIAAILEPHAWIAVNVGFRALNDMRVFEVEYRKLGYDHTSETSPQIKKVFQPVLNDIRAAREALHPVAYPDHIRLPDGHPLMALLTEQREAHSSSSD